MTDRATAFARGRAATLEAGRIAMRHFGTDHGRWEKGPGQIVTDADIEIDAFLRAALVRGDEGWVSEESATVPSPEASVWVVDPIDGTRSFAAGIPEFTISVALVQAGTPVIGLVLNPATEEFFEAVASGGTRLNGRAVHATRPAALDGARMVASQSENRKHAFGRILPGVQLTTIGSLAYKLALVAAGRFDGYLSLRRSHDWDIAAAHLLLTEAGATLTDASGSPIAYGTAELRQHGLVATGDTIHPMIVERLAPLNARTRGDA